MVECDLAEIEKIEKPEDTLLGLITSDSITGQTVFALAQGSPPSTNTGWRQCEL